MKYLVLGYKTRPKRSVEHQKVEYLGTSRSKARAAQSGSKCAFTSLITISKTGLVKERRDGAEKAASPKSPKSGGDVVKND